MLTVTGYIARQPYRVLVEDGVLLTPDRLAGDSDVAVLLTSSVGTSWPRTPTSESIPFDWADPVSVAAALMGQTTVDTIEGIDPVPPADPDVIY